MITLSQYALYFCPTGGCSVHKLHITFVLADQNCTLTICSLLNPVPVAVRLFTVCKHSGRPVSMGWVCVSVCSQVLWSVCVNSAATASTTLSSRMWKTRQRLFSKKLKSYIDVWEKSNFSTVHAWNLCYAKNYFCHCEDTCHHNTFPC